MLSFVNFSPIFSLSEKLKLKIGFGNKDDEILWWDFTILRWQKRDNKQELITQGALSATSLSLCLLCNLSQSLLLFPLSCVFCPLCTLFLLCLFDPIYHNV